MKLRMLPSPDAPGSVARAPLSAAPTGARTSAAGGGRSVGGVTSLADPACAKAGIKVEMANAPDTRTQRTPARARIGCGKTVLQMIAWGARIQRQMAIEATNKFA